MPFLYFGFISVQLLTLLIIVKEWFYLTFFLTFAKTLIVISATLALILAPSNTSHTGIAYSLGVLWLINFLMVAHICRLVLERKRIQREKQETAWIDVNSLKA